ncbi:SufD family Fe-S cluster assembly protein [Azotosporobacter soli]|uniref:SufB/SufD family protein n=1 Tax=Azotosporobacter soli TaxID=3055040 RepID=UPI0031FEBDCF
MSEEKTAGWKEKAEKATEKLGLYGADVDLKRYTDDEAKAATGEDLTPKRRKALEQVGVETEADSATRSGSYVQMNHSVLQCSMAEEGLEVMSTDQALRCHPWLEDYWWKTVSADADKYTARAALHQEHGYFIRVLPGVKVPHPVQACLYISQDGLIQDVHNMIIVEEGAELHVITGCTTDPDVKRGMHIGISEFFIKKGGKLTFTMIHQWAEEVSVRPRTGVVVEEGGVFLSNYICLKPVQDLQMYPTVRLLGKDSLARLNSILVAMPGSHLDVGGRAVLAAPGAKAEIIARTLSLGGTSINRGHLLASSAETRAHLECHGLILNPEGVIYAIPELEVRTDNAELSHEAAVGKIAPEEIEYLMARGLSEETAVATIVRGFLHVKIEGLPDALTQEIERAIDEFSGGRGA